MMVWLIAAENIQFSYYQKCLFTKLNLKVNSGELSYIKGRNGCGKTTLLRILAGILSLENGIVRYNNLKISKQRFIFYVGHELAIKYYLTVQEQLLLGPNSFFKPNKLDDVLNSWSLTKERLTLCRYLSAGQLKRVALAALVLNRAKVWILDEPYNALDKYGCFLLDKYIHSHLTQGGSVILTSHQAPAIADCSVVPYHLS